MAAGVGAGDGVITVANTFAATVEAILQAKAAPHFVDINDDTFNMSVDALREYLETHRGSGLLKAIVPVHLYGQMCDMDPILALAEEYGMTVIEDACQAHGAEYFSAKERCWKKAGSMGKAAAFSFYPGKNLGACGEAGAVTTNDAVLAERVRMLRDHGQNRNISTSSKGITGAWMPCRLRSSESSFATWIGGTKNGVKPLIRTINCSNPWMASPFRLNPPNGAEPSFTCTSFARGGAMNSSVTLRIARLQPAFTTRSQCISNRHTSILVTGKGICRYRKQPLGEVLSLPIYPQIRKEQQEQVAEALLQFYKDQIERAGVVQA